MKYNKKIVDKICKLIESDDYSILEICHQVGINQCTFFEWKKAYKDFVKKIEEADEKRLNLFKKSARSGLLILLNGKEFEEVVTEYVDKKVINNDGSIDYKPRIKSMKKTKKFILPNATSIIFTLKNLDSDNFKDIFSNENNNKNVKVIKVTKK